MSRYTEPDWSSSALITIDTQCDMLDGQPFEIPGTSAILPRMRTLLQAYRNVKKPIIHIVRIYKSDGSNVDLCRKEPVENFWGRNFWGRCGANELAKLPSAIWDRGGCVVSVA